MWNLWNWTYGLGTTTMHLDLRRGGVMESGRGWGKGIYSTLWLLASWNLTSSKVNLIFRTYHHQGAESPILVSRYADGVLSLP
jgi:hypothetical protein